MEFLCSLEKSLLPNLQRLNESFKNAKPFRYLILDNFLEPKYSKLLENEFQDSLGKPEEVILKNQGDHKHQILKRGTTDLDKMGQNQKTLVNYLQSDSFIKILQKITGIDKLYSDKLLVGGGLHESLKGGKLSVHTDFNIHHKTKLLRRLNLIIYLNSEWKDSWNGHLELWNESLEYSFAKVCPSLGKAVLFETSEISFHGFPSRLNCPEDKSRKSIALYYYSDWPEGLEARTRTNWQLTPIQWSSLISSIACLQSKHRLPLEEILEELQNDYQKVDIETAYKVLRSLSHNTAFEYIESGELIPKWKFFKENNLASSAYKTVAYEANEQLEINGTQFISNGNDPWFIINCTNNNTLSNVIFLEIVLSKSGPIQHTQIFLDFGEGFKASQVSTINDLLTNGMNYITIKCNREIHRIRIDPSNSPGLLTFESIKIAFE